MIKQRRQNILGRVWNIILPVLSVKRSQRLCIKPQRMTAKREWNDQKHQQLYYKF